MSEKNHLVTADEDDLFEVALSFKQLLDAAKESLPAPPRLFELALPGKDVFHKAIASKIFHGFQLEFVMNSGETIYGFVIGLDDFCVQVYDTGYGKDFDTNSKFEVNAYEVTGPVRHWLIVHNIESLHENFFGLKHLTRKSRDLVNAERTGIAKIAERYLKGR